MKSRDGILPAYNARTGEDVERQLIETADVTTGANDCHQLVPAVEAMDERIEVADDEQPLADAGYYRDANIQAREAVDADVHVATRRHADAVDGGASRGGG